MNAIGSTTREVGTPRTLGCERQAATAIAIDPAA